MDLGRGRRLPEGKIINFVTPTQSDETRMSKRLKNQFCGKPLFWINYIIICFNLQMRLHNHYGNQMFGKIFSKVHFHALEIALVLRRKITHK